jgi:Ankyrin repeat
MACFNRHVDVVKLLLDKGANIEAQDNVSNISMKAVKLSNAVSIPVCTCAIVEVSRPTYTKYVGTTDVEAKIKSEILGIGIQLVSILELFPETKGWKIKKSKPIENRFPGFRF